jgi:type II secretion system protein H
MNPRPERCRGFTLVEILIVVIITGMIAAVAMPGFSRAMKGAHLRTGARTLAMAHKFARNMAVLRQTPMALLVDSVGGQVEVVSFSSRGSVQMSGGFLDDREARGPESDSASEDAAPPAPAAPPPIESEFIRSLGKDVKVEAFEHAAGGEVEEIKGIYMVNYHPNGMCDGFRVRLVDANGQKVTITAEGISGAAEVVWER